MSIDWFDNRTLLTCNVLVALLFCVLLLGIRWTYPRMRGSFEAAIAFLFCIPGGVLMASQTPVTYRLTIVFADVSILLFSVFCYRAIVKFLSAPGFPRLVSAVTLLPIASIVFFTFVQDSVIARLVSLGFSVGMLRLLTAITLYRHPVKRRLMRSFAAFMLIYSLFALSYTVATALHGNPANFHPGGHTAVSNLIFAIIAFSLTGIFFLAIFGDELTDIVERRSQLDPLTGVLNRQGINLRFAAELDRATRHRQPLSVLLIDIDHFKSINDTLGHLAGDQALTEITRRILAGIRTYDLLGRFGGDEFLVLLPNTPLNTAAEIAHRILAPASTPLPHTLSIGVAQATHQEQLSALLSRADEALYEAKRAGRNCVRTSPVN